MSYTTRDQAMPGDVAALQQARRDTQPGEAAVAEPRRALSELQNWQLDTQGYIILEAVAARTELDMPRAPIGATCSKQAHHRLDTGSCCFVIAPSSVIAFSVIIFSVVADKKDYPPGTRVPTDVQP